MQARPARMIDCAEVRAGADVTHSRLRDAGSFECQPPFLPALDDAVLVNRSTGAQREAPDPEAFGELYVRYRPAVFGFALRKLHNFADAEDITSQTFLQALQAFPRYQQRGVPILSWFFQIAVNLIAGLHRASSAIPASLRSMFRQGARGGVDAPEPPDPDAAAAIAAWEATEEFSSLIRDLTTEQRMVLWLRFGDDMALATIARKMGRSAGAVKALQFRGIREVRRRLEQVEQERSTQVLALWAARERGQLRRAQNQPCCAPAAAGYADQVSRVHGGLST